MRTRLEFLFYRHNDISTPKSIPTPRILNFDICGCTAPNDWDADPDDKKHDRGYAKVMHCATGELADLEGGDKKTGLACMRRGGSAIKSCCANV